MLLHDMQYHKLNDGLLFTYRLYSTAKYSILKNLENPEDASLRYFEIYVDYTFQGHSKIPTLAADGVWDSI